MATKTKKRQEELANRFTQGFACAIGAIISAHGEGTMAIDIMRSCGYTLDQFIKDGVDENDLEKIRPQWEANRRA